MMRIFKGLAAASAISLIAATTPVYAGDFTSTTDRDGYAGVYFKLPFQGKTAAKTREGARFGFQADWTADAGQHTFGFSGQEHTPALVDLNFDTGLNLTGAALNGVDTLALRDQLHATTPEDGAFDPDLLWVLAILIAGGGGIAAAILIGDDNDDNNRNRCDYDDSPKYDTVSVDQVSDDYYDGPCYDDRPR